MLYEKHADELVIYPMKDEMKFTFSIEDNNFDNRNNKYVEFILYQYTNLRDNDYDKVPLADYLEIELPIVRCNLTAEETIEDTQWAKEVLWCPKFNDKTKIVGGYYAPKYSWIRLVLKRCDPKKRGANYCASREETDKYVKKHKISHNFQDSAANTMYAFGDSLI
tara:strand:+ start:80 stop:574 length:495 start_codon:yes stop_codon:yes gene_type:complete